jgi:TPP-dependent pyruvate/acetoin dehydrogenase alpha subunit
MIDALLEAEQKLNALGPLPFPLPLGASAPALAAAVMAMSKREWIVTGPRFRLAATLRGCPVERLVDPSTGAKPYKWAPSTLDVADRALHAVGLAISSKAPTLCVLGEASLANGAISEAFNVASLQAVPVLFLFITRTLDGAPVAKQSACTPISLAEAYGISSVQTQDIEILTQELKRARSQSNPFVIQFLLE